MKSVKVFLSLFRRATHKGADLRGTRKIARKGGKRFSRNAIVWPRVMGFAVLAAFCLTTTWAQSPTGRIIGNVTDPSGAAIPGARVTATNVGTNISRETTTGPDGFYQILALPIGTYDVAIRTQGFLEQKFENQHLQINQSLRIDAQMTIGSQSQIVTVKAQAAGVETENSTVGATVVGSEIQQAPLNGRNALDLAKLEPGVTEVNPGSSSAGNYSIDGGRPDSVNYVLDGSLDNNLLDNSVVYNPNPDAIAEFHILESDYSAEYGRNAGGIISIVTKSGTNQFHGSLYDYVRNDAFDANSFFNKLQGLPRDVLKRHQFGATLGGPINKNKLFFFESYQGTRQTVRETPVGFSITPVFTPAELNGDFSHALGPGPGMQDPGVAAFLLANPFFQPNPALAAQAIIDPATFNAAAKNYIAAGLVPSSPNGLLPGAGPGTYDVNESTTKIDYSINSNDKLTGTVGFNWTHQTDTFAMATLGGLGLTSTSFPTVPGFARGSHIKNYFLNIAYDHVFSANLLNEFRVFGQRNFNLTGVPLVNRPTPAAFGINITPDLANGPPSDLSFSNGLYLGVGNRIQFSSNTVGTADTLSWVHGPNLWKFGAGISVYKNFQTFDSSNGVFTFQGPGGSGTGNAFADFLLGVPTTFTQGPRGVSNGHTKAAFAFLQDRWRVSKRLTLNLGLRYEYYSPKHDTLGRTFSVIPGLQSTRFANAPPGLVFPGDRGAPAATNFPDRDNFAPRIGFAWDPSGKGKTSIRGGFGIFYDVVNGGDLLDFNGIPPFYGSSFVFFPPPTPPQTGVITYFSDPYGSTGTPNPFPDMPPSPSVNFANAGFLPYGNSPYSTFDAPHQQTPYVYQYNLGIQRELVPGLVLELEYVGSSSHGLLANIESDPFAINSATYNYNNPLGPQRVLNLQPGAATCQDQALSNLLPPGPPPPPCSFGVLPQMSNAAKAHYNSFQAGLTKQTGDLGKFGSASFTLGYTYGINRDDCSFSGLCALPVVDRSHFMSYADMDVRQRLTFSGGWNLPFDRLWTSAPKKLTQGWTVFPIVTWRTGFPISIPAFPNFFALSLFSEGPSGLGDPTLVKANIVGPTAALNPHQIQTINGNTGSYWLNPNSFSAAQSAFDNPFDPNLCAEFASEPAGTLPSDAQAVACPGVRTYGSLRRNSLRGPGETNLDFSVAKTTRLTERVALEIEGDFFNIFNQTQFQNPDNTITDVTFGQITTTYPPRIIQLAARLSF